MWEQLITDATSLDGGFEHVTTILRFKRAGRTINICLSMALTDSRTAEGEVKTIDERVFNRLRIWLASWREVQVPRGPR